MERNELIELVHSLFTEDLDEEEEDRLQERFISAVPHPAPTDLIYYPQNWGFDRELNVQEIVDAALSWKPQILAMKIIDVRPHPRRKELRCYGVEVVGKLKTQVVGPAGQQVGDVVAVALSGARLTDGSRAEHGFVDKAFTVGRLLGTTTTAPGNELPMHDYPIT